MILLKLRYLLLFIGILQKIVFHSECLQSYISFKKGLPLHTLHRSSTRYLENIRSTESSLR